MSKLLLMILIFCNAVLSGVAQVRITKNIDYSGQNLPLHDLNIYADKKANAKDVIVFIHGGSWSSGKKETYWWLGRNFAKKDVVVAVIDYPLAPNATYKEMAVASAKAVKWVRDSIAIYGGNPDRIFLMGHSAGAHLCELINADTSYFKQVGLTNLVKGIILNDAFGLDMEEYLTKSIRDHYYDDFIRTFSENSETWRMGSPLFYVKEIKNPHLIFYGTKTYPAIQLQSERIYQNLKMQNIPAKLTVIEGKKHVGMISQMIFSNNRMYKDILDFMKSVN